MTSYGVGTASAKDGGEDESDGESDEENEEGEEEKRMAGLRGMKRGGRRKGIEDSSAEGNKSARGRPAHPSPTRLVNQAIGG